MSDRRPGLQMYLDGVKNVEDDLAQTDLEAEIESVIAEALRDHPFVDDGATVSADYVQVDE